jgi:hypothetical protein
VQYFHARLASGWWPSQTIHRVYITDKDFLFVHLDVSTLLPEKNMNQVPVATGGGAIPALIGYCMAKSERAKLERIYKSLDAADEEVLREFIEGDEDSFVLPFQEVQSVCLEPKTFWGSLFCRDLLSFLKLTRTSDKPLTLALVAPNEMATVAEEMRRLFDDVQCELPARAF